MQELDAPQLLKNGQKLARNQDFKILSADAKDKDLSHLEHT
jgi:hypothetical protein